MRAARNLHLAKPGSSTNGSTYAPTVSGLTSEISERADFDAVVSFGGTEGSILGLCEYASKADDFHFVAGTAAVASRAYFATDVARSKSDMR